MLQLGVPRSRQPSIRVHRSPWLHPNTPTSAVGSLQGEGSLLQLLNPRNPHQKHTFCASLQPVGLNLTMPSRTLLLLVGALALATAAFAEAKQGNRKRAAGLKGEC